MNKRFIKINDEFLCGKCGEINPPADKTCRNHCRKCLYSLHVDVNPGDRASKCHGWLKPIEIEISAGEMKSIKFKCEKCDQISRNKIADDDNRQKLFEILEKI
jgi:predicted RNA-binding Zn-ribbon protein involved in translation (DUF1610 family)